MSNVQHADPVPSRISVGVFLVKSSLLKLRRAVQNARAGLEHWPTGDRSLYPALLAEVKTPLRSDVALTERVLQQGKVQNLRCAVRHLRRIVIPAGGRFSFWRQIGRATQRRGYVAGRQIREGCIVPAIGGGLCQLSNALYELALQGGCEIIERHAHTRVVPGSAAALGRDATVYWNYVDLQFRTPQPVMLDAQLTADMLIVRLYGHQLAAVARTVHTESSTHLIALTAAPVHPDVYRSESPSHINASQHQTPEYLNTQHLLLVPTDAGRTCLSCGVEACFRHRPNVNGPTAAPSRAGVTYLLDEWSPEFAQWLRAQRSADDRLGIPIDGRRWGLARYAWETAGYAEVHTATVETLRSSLAVRRLAAQGVAPPWAQLRRAEALADRLAKLLRPDCEQVCVAQSLLPYLWQQGHLGGRRFTVLLTRQPMAILEANSERAALHPTSPTTREFRALDWLTTAETAAIEAAERLITPHVYLVALFPHKTELLPSAV